MDSRELNELRPRLLRLRMELQDARDYLDHNRPVMADRQIDRCQKILDSIADLYTTQSSAKK